MRWYCFIVIITFLVSCGGIRDNCYYPVVPTYSDEGEIIYNKN